jgi:tetratricopeptide (TPR) repeat protein
MAGRSKYLALFVIASLSAVLSACSDLSWDRSYNLRQWEKIRLTAEADFLAGEYEPAEKLLADALSYAEKLGAGNFRIAVTLSQLGDVLVADGKPEAARAEYGRALALLTKNTALAASDSDRRFFQEIMTNVLLNLGDIAFRLKNLNEAGQYYGQVVASYKQWGESAGSRVFAEDFGRAFAGMALVKASQGDKLGARQLVKEALAAPSASFYSHGLTGKLTRLTTSLDMTQGDNAVASALQSDEQFRNFVLAAKELEASKDFAGAAAQYELATKEGSRVGVDDKTMGSTYFQLGDCQGRLQQQTAAADSYRRALAYFEKMKGKLESLEEESLEKLLSRLGHTCHEIGDDKDAVAYFKRQLEMRKLSYGQDSGQAGETLSYLAEAELSLGNTSDALRDARAAWTRLKNNNFKPTPVVLAKERLAIVFLALSKYDEASAANQDLLNQYEGKKAPRARRLLTAFRAAAISALAGHSHRGLSAGEIVSDATTCLSGTKEWQKLLDSMKEEARFLSDHGQRRAGAMMCQWEKQLAGG